MIKVVDLLIGSTRFLPNAEQDVDPFATDDVLLEAQVLSSLSIAGAGVAGVLLDLRMAMQLDVGSAGLLVARRGVRIDIDLSSVDESPVAIPILSSSSDDHSDRSGMRLEVYPAGEISIFGGEIQFFVLDIPGLPEAPPDYTEPGWSWGSPDIPQWQSECNVLFVSESKSM